LLHLWLSLHLAAKRINLINSFPLEFNQDHDGHCIADGLGLHQRYLAGYYSRIPKCANSPLHGRHGQIGFMSHRFETLARIGLQHAQDYQIRIVYISHNAFASLCPEFRCGHIKFKPVFDEIVTNTLIS
jgi:hypothetical protein